MKRYQLLIFDWDGTLMDSANKIVACFQAAAKDLGLPLIKRDIIEIQIGLSLERAWENILSVMQLPASKVLIDQATERYRDYFLEIDHTPMPLYAGVEAGIQALDKAGYLLAIATGKARRGLVRALEETDLAPNFVVSRCADEAFSKPHPQMVLDILDFTGINANASLMVGDTTYDMQMAQNAKVDGLAVSYGVHAEAALLPLATQGCVSNFKQVLDELL